MARAMSVCVSLHYGCIRLRNGDLFLYDDSLWAPIVCLAIPVRTRYAAQCRDCSVKAVRIKAFRLNALPSRVGSHSQNNGV